MSSLLLDMSFVADNKSGTGRSLLKILPVLAELYSKDNKVFILSFNNLDLSYIDSKINIIKLPINFIQNYFIRIIYLYIIVYPYIRFKYNIDTIVGMSNYTAWPYLFKNKFLIIHDIIVVLDTKRSRLIRLFTDLLLKLSILDAKKIITISEKVRLDVIDRYKYNRKNIHAILTAIDTDIFNRDNNMLINKILNTATYINNTNNTNIDTNPLYIALQQQYGSYIFAWSSIEHRKNFPLLVRAFEKSELYRNNIKLIIGGKPSTGWDDLQTTIQSSPVKDYILVLGKLQDTDLINLIINSAFVVSVSKFEGAGTTPVEARCLEKYTLVSSIPSHKEYLQDDKFVVWCDPNSLDSIATNLKLIYNLSKENQFTAPKFRYDYSYNKKAIEIFTIFTSNSVCTD